MAGMFDTKTPKIQPASRMPDQQDPAVLEAQRKAREEQALRGGRASTILTDQLGSKLGAR